MIDLVWNFPLLPDQQETWSRYLATAVAEQEKQPVEALRPSFRTVDHAMRERAAKWLGYPVDRTWMTSGGHHGTLIALLASGLAGTRVALEGATYPGFLDQCWLTKTHMVACAVDDDGLVPDSLREACARAKADCEPIRGLFTMPTVQNPLGFVTSHERREEIVAIAREYELTIIEDDAYGYLTQNPPPSYARLAPERTFYVRGLAKSLAPGARTGFLVAAERAGAALETALRCTATGTDVPHNMAALAMCEDGSLDALMQAKREEGARRNREARRLLEDACAPGAESAWHVWVRLPEDIEPGDVEEAIKTKGVMVTNGQWCAVGPEWRHGLRLALGAEVRREDTIEGVRRVAEIVRTFWRNRPLREMPQRAQ